MKSVCTPLLKTTAKVLTGVTGFDEITGWGLPCSRTSLRVGGLGSGKAVLRLQFPEARDEH